MNKFTRRIAAVTLAGGLGILGLAACGDSTEEDCKDVESLMTGSAAEAELSDDELADAVNTFMTSESGSPEEAAAVETITEKCDIEL